MISILYPICLFDIRRDTFIENKEAWFRQSCPSGIQDKRLKLGRLQLYGLEAINAANGWSMSILGASIVFSGLVILSLAIAQLHKILNFWENRKDLSKNGKADTQLAQKEASKITHPDYCPEDIHEAAAIYRPLFAKLGATFQLVDLYKLSQDNNFPHPHITISRLREANILEPVGDGVFQWKQS